MSVQQFIDLAWNAIPASVNGTALTNAQRAYYAAAYLSAMRGNWSMWEYLMQNDDLFRAMALRPPNDDDPENINLAYAQHYMIGRWMAAASGDNVGSRSIVGGYEVIKIIEFNIGRKDDLRTDKHHPPSPPSRDAVQWGVNGVIQGMKDYKQTHNGKTGDTGDAYILMWPFIMTTIHQPENTPNVPQMIKTIPVLIKSIQIIIDQSKQTKLNFSSQAVDSATVFCSIVPPGQDDGLSGQADSLSSPSGGDDGGTLA